MVFSSPHSGRQYTRAFINQSRLEPRALRQSEDAFVDEIFAAAPEFGAPLIEALFPRAYVDANQEAFELDPNMFADDLPDYVRTRSPRIAAGLGTIPEWLPAAALFIAELCRSAAAHRAHHRPYHLALEQLLEGARRRFGVSLLIDCHSIPSPRAPGCAPRALTTSTWYWVTSTERLAHRKLRH